VARAVVPLGEGDEARIERLIIKSSGQTEIRLSWWKDGRMMMRPLDLPERDLMTLLPRGVLEGVICLSWERPESILTHALVRTRGRSAQPALALHRTPMPQMP
jgi:hypothetical protein